MKVHQFTMLLLLPFLACSRNSGGNNMNVPTGLQAKIAGKWTIQNVTSLFFDSTGVPWSVGQQLYVCPPGYYYQFNSNNTWTEILLPDTLAINGMSGTYTIDGDSSFTLVNPAAPAPVACKVDTLGTGLFVFENSRGTHFNGVTPGYIRYRIHMTKN